MSILQQADQYFEDACDDYPAGSAEAAIAHGLRVYAAVLWGRWDMEVAEAWRERLADLTVTDSALNAMKWGVISLLVSLPETTTEERP